MLSQIGQTFNRKEVVRALVLKNYAVKVIEEEIESLEHENCNDMELMRGLYDKLDQAKGYVKYYRSLIN